jgi:MFS family permease
MLFFWTLFEGIIGFTVPFLIKNHGISITSFGLIYASSSICGAVFDFVASKIFRNTTYRRFYLYMFALSLLYIMVLWRANHIIWFLIGMSIWGIYYDFHNLGNFDFVHRVAQKQEHVSYFGVIGVFRSLGYLIAPLIAGMILVNKSTEVSLSFSLVFLFISFVIYTLIIKREKTTKGLESSIVLPKPSLSTQLKAWKKLSRILLPTLLIIILVSISNAFVGTVGPLLSEDLARQHYLGLFFIPMFILPIIFIGWFEGAITARYGVKQTAYFSFILGSLILALLLFISSVYLIILIVFISSIFTSLAMPAINGFYEDFIDDLPETEHEVAGLSDFFYNLGYIIGPAAAGIFGGIFGLRQAFGVLGICCAVLTFLIFVLDKKRDLRNL